MDIIATIAIILFLLFLFSLSGQSSKPIKNYKPTDNPPIETYIAKQNHLRKLDQEKRDLERLKQDNYGHEWNHCTLRCLHCNVSELDANLFRLESNLICTRLTGADKPMSYKEILLERYLND